MSGATYRACAQGKGAIGVILSCQIVGQSRVLGDLHECCTNGAQLLLGRAVIYAQLIKEQAYDTLALQTPADEAQTGGSHRKLRAYRVSSDVIYWRADGALFATLAGFSFCRPPFAPARCQSLKLRLLLI